MLQSRRNPEKAGKDICFLCEEVRETTPASSWCSDCQISVCERCAKMHLKAPSSKNHNLTVGVSNLSAGVKVERARPLICTEHKGEHVKFICRDCNKAACQTCCTIQHRKCKNVVTIGSMIPHIKSVLSEKRRNMGKKMEEYVAIMGIEESRMEQLNESETRTEERIKSTIEHLASSLKEKENGLLKELRDVIEKQSADHQATLRFSQITIQRYQQHCQSIDLALQSESEVDMYDMYQVCLSGALESVVDTETDIRNSPIVDVNFTPDLEPLKKAITELGDVNVTSQTVDDVATGREKKIIRTISTLVFHDSINIKHKDDDTDPDPVDVIALNVKGVISLVVADFCNTSLKSVYKRRGRYEISKLNLLAKPFALAKISESRVAATVTGSRIVIAAEARPRLSLVSTVNTRKDYTCLTALPDSTLAAGADSPPAVDILDLRGHLLRSFTSKNTGLNVLQNPYYLCTSREGNILVSDRKSRSVYCLTSMGAVVFTYVPTGDKALKNPRGVAVTDEGDVLLADSFRKEITQLSSDGTFVGIVPTSNDGIDNPWGLCVGDANKLYMCQSGTEKGIMVFSFI